MDALEALHSRTSMAALAEPGPTPEQLRAVLQAGVRANDHGMMRPWKFLIIEGEARKKFGAVMAEVMRAGKPDMTEAALADIAAKPLRAPTIIAVVAATRPNPKVPQIEQILAAGGAAQLMTAAAFALGVGSIWRTGSFTYERRTHDLLGLSGDDHLVGFLYLGTPKAAKAPSDVDVDSFVTHWR
jgi:nitroreductase